jgi:hypothetical protein
MKKDTSKRWTREQAAERKALAALSDSAIDTSDAPELLAGRIAAGVRAAAIFAAGRRNAAAGDLAGVADAR